ncbi:hypothetical protein ABN763_14340 [Spongiivirga sp. MCCC 1A20706]|uniref:hypothetical protein n=1 Tax=Spongiivirga sp. MCCC 1A20706 TaxID=3160963 RepID=UPI003977807C
MKKNLIVALLLLAYVGVKAQSSNLDREYFKTSYVLLPTDPILNDKDRTFNVSVTNAMNSSSRRDIAQSRIKINGFSKLDNNGNLDIDIEIFNVELGDMNIEKREVENKDKEGKVTSVSRYYKVVWPYKTYATMSVNNQLIGENKNFTYGKGETYNSDEFRSYTKAKEFYNNNRYNLRDRFKSDFFKSVVGDMNYTLNKKYGYRIADKKDQFWILDSRKHPETPKHKEMYELMKEAFASKMKSDVATDELAAALAPAIEYFEGVPARYPGDKKRIRKLRYSSYYNLANIYYYLDNPEKTIEYGQMIIDNDYDKSDGKQFIKDGEYLRKQLDKNKLSTRHFEIVSEDLTGQAEMSFDEVEAEAAQPSEMVAYLITTKNDTIAAKMNEASIKDIAFTAKVRMADEDGNVGDKFYKAKNCQALALSNGDMYEVIRFKESSTKEGAVDVGQMALGGASPKFAKVLHKSDKIELYLFNNEEIVLKRPADEKGKSTSGTGFIFGFKKKLAAYAEGCPAVAEKAMNKEFKNTVESLTQFCEMLSKCESESKP